MLKKNTTKKKLNKLYVRARKELSLLHSSRFLSLAIPALILLFFVVLGIALLNMFRYQINPDATSYIQIAKHYAAGDIREAVNGYWSPLISWLLIPFVWAQIDLQLAAKIISLLASFVSVLIVWFILSRQKITWWISSSILLVTSALLLNWSLAGPITGDLLFLLFILITPLLTVRFLKSPNLLNSLLLSGAGSLVYFSKAIGFYIFIVYLVIIFISEKKYSWESAKKYMVVFLAFLTFIAPFVAAISYKDRGITVSTASRYNIELAKRFTPGQSEYPHPMNWQNIFFPLKPYHYSIHENPDALTQTLKNNMPATKRNAVENYYNNVLNNFKKLLSTSYTFMIILGMGFLFYRRQRNINDLTFYNLFLAYITLIALGGVLLSIFELRYIYPLIVASFIGIAMLLEKSREHIPAVLCCVALSIAAIPVFNNIFQNAYANYDLYLQSSRVNTLVPKGSNTISDSASSLYFCYYGEFRCVGNAIITKDSLDEMNKYFKQHNIKYYIITNPDTLKRFGKENILQDIDVKVITTFFE